MERRAFLKSGLALAGAALAPHVARAGLPRATAAGLDALAGRLRGAVLRPGDPAYGAHRLAWNGRYDHVPPAGVVMAADEGDVAEAIRFARDAGLDFALRGGGHSFAGFSTTPGLVIDLQRLAAVAVADDGETARVGAGMTNLPLYEALWPHRKAVPGGTCPTVGIAGLALGGGFGRLSPLHGLTSDHLVGLRMVDADGGTVVVDAERDPDLLWAHRGGGGGNFAR